MDARVISNFERPLIVTLQAIQGRGLVSAGYLGVNAASCVGTTLKHTMQRTGNVSPEFCGLLTPEGWPLDYSDQD
ncbi:hypothetical protein N7505_007406 [Penicillium chrysogenum]|uniref:Uncharacterized protein n=1 Tax=Penicillium chrysogenum TaxID=5076 RepID=A0ABQ8WEK2_PENCH|nr:hypothetical protein N7505_007406 [Penicillium chrysogenum]